MIGLQAGDMETECADQQGFRPLSGLVTGGGNEFHLRHFGQQAGRAVRQVFHIAQKGRLRSYAISRTHGSQQGAKTAAGKGQMPCPAGPVERFDGQPPRDAAIGEGHERDGLVCGKIRVGRSVPAHVFGPELLPPGLRRASHAAPDVQFTLFQKTRQTGREADRHRNLKEWMGGAEGSEDLGKACQEQVFRYTQTDRTTRRILPEAGQDAVLALEKLSRQTDERYAILGQSNAFGASGQKARAKLLLQPADMLADGGLADPLALRGGCEVQRFRDREKGLQMERIEMHLIFHANMWYHIYWQVNLICLRYESKVSLS